MCYMTMFCERLLSCSVLLILNKAPGRFSWGFSELFKLIILNYYKNSLITLTPSYPNSLGLIALRASQHLENKLFLLINNFRSTRTTYLKDYSVVWQNLGEKQQLRVGFSLREALCTTVFPMSVHQFLKISRIILTL